MTKLLLLRFIEWVLGKMERTLILKDAKGDYWDQRYDENNEVYMYIRCRRTQGEMPVKSVPVEAKP